MFSFGNFLNIADPVEVVKGNVSNRSDAVMKSSRGEFQPIEREVLVVSLL